MIRQFFHKTWRQMDAYQKAIRGYQLGLLSLFLVIVLQHHSLSQALKTPTVYVAPTILSHGGNVQAGVIPDALIAGFASETFSAINTWEGSEAAYEDFLTQKQYFLSADYYQQLRQEMVHKKMSGQFERIRLMVPSHAYETPKVTVLSDHSWQVDIVMHLEERVEATIIKDVFIRYPLKVVQTQLSHSLNPYGLQLSGFAADPVRLTSEGNVT